MSRFVVDSNNLWLLGITDGTIKVVEGPYLPDLNTHDVPRDVMNWKQAARIGTSSVSTHRELEVFGTVFSGQKVEELRSGITGAQRMVNREGFTVTWLNPRGGSTTARPDSLLRRLNDLYDWSKHGVQVPFPVETAWDRFELTTGKLMVEGGGSDSSSPQMKKELEEKEKEHQRLQAEKDKEIEELKKQAKEKEDQQLAANKENEELKKQVKEKDDQLAAKNDELAAKDKQIANLKNALSAFV